MGATIGTPLLWVGFTAVILVMLALDLGVFNRKAHTVRPREALLWTVVWVSLALAFNVCIWLRAGAAPAMEFLTGYLIEKALSVDNIFVFLVIFSYFSVPTEYQHRVLFWGVLGAIVLRAIFIALGATLLHQFHWIIYVFGGFLVLTGFRILGQKHEDVHPERNPVLILFRRFVPMTRKYHGAKFMVMEAGKRLATPLLMVLTVVEATDVIFAVDSIPAIFAVTEDPFIVYTSNIFAILGLRALYFLLADIMDRFTYLKFGLGSVLIFVGGKMVISKWYEVPIVVSLVVVASLLLASVTVSLLFRPTVPPLPEHEHGSDQDVPPFPRDEEARITG